ncbi:hypothetical protein SAMN05216207_102111 [Pseudonocardia ammonioxydans]|uniref:Uncharacterized protein n=1 Tax=Pseudonocardia ammonioxydans TaxID=260086 RepID=A0A1I5BRI2_PSUAM|nr:hypothetical protein [Pseudonocardia ammonioxydans]SFN77253.1 hypothetical protein SAMN05216207_102111 [Pseudonocardia ammonioxydans]
MTARTAGRAALAVAGAGALAALTGGLAHADTPDGPATSDATGSESAGTETTGAEEAGSVPVFLLDGVPALPLPDALVTPVDLTAPVFGVLDGLT